MPLILPGRLTQQPQHAALIDWSSPLAKGLVFAFEPAYLQRNAASGVPGEALGAGVARAAGINGIEYAFSGAQASRSCSFGVNQSLMGAPAATWDILIKFNAANPSSHFFGQWDNSVYWLMQANAGTLVWVAADDNSGNRSRFDVASAFTASGYYRVIASWRGSSGGTGDRSVLINGVEKSSSQSSAAATAIGTANTLDYLQLGMVAGGTPLNGSIVFARAWARGMSLAEMRALNNSPYQMFKAPARKVWLPSSGASNLAAAASGASSAGGSASLAAQVALGAVGVALASGSAAPGAAVPLSAAGISVADGSAGATATVTISAAGLAQAAGSAGLSAAVLLAAAGAAQASGNADLSAQLSALAAGAAQAGGSATLSSDAVGEISAAGAATAAGSGVLAVTVQLVATGGAVAGGLASLSGGAAGALSASGAAQSGGSATTSVTVNISAEGFVQAMGAGELAVYIPLQATGGAAAGGLASLSAGGVVRVVAPCRTLLVAPETRRLQVNAERRRVGVRAENRRVRAQ